MTDEERERVKRLFTQTDQSVRTTAALIAMMNVDDPHWDLMHDAYFTLARVREELQKELNDE